MTLAELRRECTVVGPLGDAYEFKDDGVYFVFVDPRMIDLESLAHMPAVPTDAHIQFISVIPAPGQTIDDAIRIYQEKTR